MNHPFACRQLLIKTDPISTFSYYKIFKTIKQSDSHTNLSVDALKLIDTKKENGICFQLNKDLVFYKTAIIGSNNLLFQIFLLPYMTNVDSFIEKHSNCFQGKHFFFDNYSSISFLNEDIVTDCCELLDDLIKIVTDVLNENESNEFSVKMEFIIRYMM